MPRLERRSGKPAQPAHEGEEFVDPHVAVERGVLRHVADALARAAWPSRTTSKPPTRTVPALGRR